jgi:hypothetical protein
MSKSNKDAWIISGGCTADLEPREGNRGRARPTAGWPSIALPACPLRTHQQYNSKFFAGKWNDIEIVSSHGTGGLPCAGSFIPIDLHEIARQKSFLNCPDSEAPYQQPFAHLRICTPRELSSDSNSATPGETS